MNQDMEEAPQGNEPTQCMENTQNDSGIVEYIDLARGVAKWSHESSDSDKEQSAGDLTHKNIEEHQLTIVGPVNVRWIQVKSKKGKKGRIKT